MSKEILLNNIPNIHTTFLGEQRIKVNLSLKEDSILFCKNVILNPLSTITRKGKNWYVEDENCIITINAYNYCIITAHKKKK